MFEHVKLFDFNFISVSDISLIAADIMETDSFEKEGKLPFLITPNVDHIVLFDEDEYKYLKKYFLNSTYILPDGIPIVWASKLFFKHKIARRIAGSDLLPLLLKNSLGVCKILALTNSDAVTNALNQNNPNVVSCTLPFIDEKSEEEIEEMRDRYVKIIKDENIRIVIIGISFPNQNILAIKIYEKLKLIQIDRMPLICMLGASFEFHFQFKKRAPLIMQKLGLEWLHRVASEPKRLFKRYFIQDTAFFSLLFKEILNNRNNQAPKPVVSKNELF